MVEFTETEKNQYGVTIVKCCASCIHKILSGNDKRDCKQGEKNVKPSYLCPLWQMNPKLEKAGKGGGRIKKKHWFTYFRDYGKGRPIEDITVEYEALFGSKFLTK